MILAALILSYTKGHHTLVDWQALLDKTQGLIGGLTGDESETSDEEDSGTTSSPAESTGNTGASTAPPLSPPDAVRITDTSGRVLECLVIGKLGNELAIRRLSDNYECLLPLSKVAPEDRGQFLNMADFGQEELARILTGNTIPPERVGADKVVWHSTLDRGESESRANGRPIFLLFTGTDWCPASKTLEAEVFNSSTFRGFANSNLVLVKVDLPQSGASGPAQALAQRYNVKALPSAFLIPPGLPGRSFKYNGLNPVHYTQEITKQLQR